MFQFVNLEFGSQKYLAPATKNHLNIQAYFYPVLRIWFQETTGLLVNSHSLSEPYDPHFVTIMEIK